MTLSERNILFRGGMVFAALSLILVTAGGYFTYSIFPHSIGEAAMRPEGIVQKLVESFAESSAYVPFWTIIVAVAYSLISIILIHYFFEKTQSPEILFIGFFVISLTFEFARIVIPLRDVFPFPPVFTIVASRVLIFGRYFGLFSLFAASVYAAGLDAQKQQTFLIMLILAALVIALNVPIDALVWDSTFTVKSSYRSMFSVIEAGILAITLVSFLISAYTRGSKSYLFIAVGILLVFAGRNILIYSDTWLTPIPGLLSLALGTWFVCSRLHSEYLWL